MVETSIIVNKLVVATLWTAVGLLIISAWISWAVGGESVANLLGLTSCATSAAATTAHIRRYASRVCFMIRASTIGQAALDEPIPVRLLRD